MKWFWCVALVAAVATVAGVVPSPVAATGDRGQAVPPSEVTETGAQVYTAHCASCHGVTGTGDGPVAAALRQKPANLTTLARRRQGTFPRVEVSDFVVGRSRIGAHGTRDMPVWGPLFQEMNPSNSRVDVRLARLMDYLESLQVK